MYHLRAQTSHGDYLGVQDCLPQGVCDGTAGATGTSGFSGTLLGALGIGCAESETATGEATTKAGLEARMHNVGKEICAFVLSFFCGVHVETAVVSQYTATHVKGTAGTPKASETMNFETKE